MGKRWARLCALFGSLIVIIGTTTAASLAATAATGQSSAKAAASAGVAPNATSEMDCNGHSPKYKDVKQDLGGGCTDPLGYWNGQSWRFKDNGVYIGHDEPSVKFISQAPGTGNNMAYVMRLATDPHAQPTISPTGKTVSDYAELSPAPWFGLPICDPNSYPLNPCTPDSDTNSGAINDPNAAGSAFMELQFYPPGYAPWLDGPSCDATPLVRCAQHRQPGVRVQLREPEPELHGAGQLRLPAAQRRARWAAQPAAGRRAHVHPEPADADDELGRCPGHVYP